tara:strand:- start:3616 stop:3852 length:237 start_codon:yes stop_codon:yes gene_type:complete
MDNQNAITNFMYFGHNYPHDFISEVWSSNPSLADHLESKFHSMYEHKGTLTFFSWFMELDGMNKNQLTQWVMLNYPPK